MTTIYLHGAPGSPAELALFGSADFEMSTWDRFADRPHLCLDDYLDAVCREITRAANGACISVVGFSLGARPALEISGRLAGIVDRVELISPAGPLELGHFLPRMEGRLVFGVARTAPWLLPPLTWAQARMVNLAPHRLLNLMFANATAADVTLVADPCFVAAMIQLLKQSLSGGAAGYQREIRAYVKPWSSVLARVSAPVRIWQGGADNWTPPDMARALQAALPNAEPMRLLDGLSHYSTLRLALRELAAARRSGGRVAASDTSA